MRVHFVNENVGGHTTMHLAIRDTLSARHPEVRASWYDVPAPVGARRLVGARVPGLDRLDADLQPLRIQLAASAVVRRHLDHAPAHDVLHVYTHNVALASVRHLRARPSVVSLDATNAQNAYRLPQRRPTRVTPVALRPTMALERRVYAAASAVVAQSRWAATSLVEDYGVDPGKIEVIPFGITVPPMPRRPTEERELPVITFVGRSMDRKGGWRLVDQWRRHLRDRSRLVLVTREHVPPEPGLTVRNDIRPGDGRLGSVLAETDVFAFPTELDTFGYAAVEAMAAGVAVVATGTAALPEVVADGETGFLVPVGDDVALRTAIERLVEDPALRRRMGDAGRRRVESKFSAHLTTEALLDVLHRVAGRGAT